MSRQVGLFAPEQLRRVIALLDARADILEVRVTGPAAPAWCRERGWTPFLLGLDDATVDACEADGAARVLLRQEGLPASLRELAIEALSASEIPSVSGAEEEAALLSASPRKRDQIAALAALAPRGAGRILDFGSGRGHLTRRLAKTLGVPAVGFERRPEVVAAARAIAPDPEVTFESQEIGASLDVRPDDLLVGLHACGGLGDALIRCAASAGAAVLLVPCCPQKISGEVRAPLSRDGRPLARELLGLANLAAAAAGVSAAGVSAVDGNERRRTRVALRLLLQDAGLTIAPGAEARGINRRRFREGLAGVAGPAFERRGLPAPSASAMRRADAKATEDYRRIRRFSVARALLARPLELAIVLDRAAALAEAGGAQPTVVEAFPSAVSPRNLLVRRSRQDPR